MPVIGPVFRFLGREPVLSISLALAASSSAMVRPSVGYFDYIDFKVLACLFCLMAVVEGLRKTGLFDRAAAALTRHTVSVRAMAAILVGATFFMSMAITNDVALITFIPFSLLLMKKLENPGTRIRVITLQTIAANTGSAMTPIGNPQNLFLFSFYSMDAAGFFAAIFPVVLTGAIMLAIALCTIRDEEIPKVSAGHNYDSDARFVFAYALFFLASVLAVFRVIDYRILTLVLILFLLFFDRRLILRVDYSLLLTFVGFFVFIGNLQHIRIVSDFLTRIVNMNVTLIAALSSQIISNVPAAILLSGFTGDSHALLRGVSIGGMGTLIASLASVISFKFFSQDRKGETLRYLGVFTFWNFLFLAVLYLLCVVCR
jgi:Na+/H+ antiporter NhaD/arsenite permease-like protein